MYSLVLLLMQLIRAVYLYSKEKDKFSLELKESHEYALEDRGCRFWTSGYI